MLSWTKTAALSVLAAAYVSLGCDPSEAPDAAEADPPTAEDATPAAATPPAQDAEPRWVTLGGAVTEIIAALGHGDAIVGVDASSTYPESITAERPQVGYYRKLSAEGILALRPTHVLASEASGPESALNHLRDAKVKLTLIPDATTPDEAIARITTLGELTGDAEKADELISALRADLNTVARRRDASDLEGCAVFIYARGPNVLMVSGADTTANAMLELAGIDNCIDGYDGFKPLTPEALIAASPAYIVAPQAGAESIGGAEGVLELPGVSETPAGTDQAFVFVDDLALLGFGPRMGEALMALQDGVDMAEAPAEEAQ